MREKETKYAIRLSALAKLLCQQCIHCDDDDCASSASTATMMTHGN